MGTGESIRAAAALWNGSLVMTPRCIYLLDSHHELYATPNRRSTPISNHKLAMKQTRFSCVVLVNHIQSCPFDPTYNTGKTYLLQSYSRGQNTRLLDYDTYNKG